MSAAPAVRRGPHYAHAAAGPFEELDRYAFDGLPDAPPWVGKLFLKEHAGGTGAEASLNRLPPGGSVDFLHRHRRNDEWYLFAAGAGEFVVDGETFTVAEGSAVRVDPAGARALRNTGDGPLVYWCVQTPADGDAGSTIRDGALVEGVPPWAGK